jgi:putative zinc finger/helix-turn-helix YgiT family protein
VNCPNCKKEKTLRAWTGTFTVMGVDVPAKGQRCSACEETLFAAGETEKQERAAADVLVERGLRTAAEFRFVRKMAGLKATELADLLDVRPETVSRWERGEVEIPRPVAFVLGELYVRPRVTRQKFEALA